MAKKKKAGKRKSAKRVAAAKKAARTRKRNEAARRASAKKAARARKRSKPARSTSRKPKKAARKTSRKGKRKGKRKSRVSRKVTASARRGATSHKSEVNVRVTAAAEPKRKPSRKGRGRKRSMRETAEMAYENPLSLGGVGDFVVSLLAVLFGGGVASLAQRAAATHALTQPTGEAGATAPPNPTDTPDTTKMQIYNAESVGLPIWSSWMRMLAAALSIAAPLGISAFVKSTMARSFWQLAGFGAIAFTGVKTLDDVVSKVGSKSNFALRMYAPELASQNRYTQVYPKGSTPTANMLPAVALLDNTGAAAVTFAGRPRPAGTAAAPPPPPPPAPRTVAAPPAGAGHPNGAIPPGSPRIDEARMRNIHGFNPFNPASE